jgi:hypothetical protein
MAFLPNWRTILWKSWAIKVLALIAALATALLVPEVREMVPPEWVRWAVLASALAGILLRLLDQGIDNVDADSGIDTRPNRPDPEPSGPSA